MIKASTPELRLHFTVLESGNDSLNDLTNVYSEHLLSCLQQWYGNNLYDDPSLADEAVYRSLRQYSEHPRRFNPEHGCLVRFLEINADRTMQEIFERENYPVFQNAGEHYLARCFDNERDVQLARLIITKQDDVATLVGLLDIGSYRIALQLSEIKRHTQRVRKVLEESKPVVSKTRKQRSRIKAAMVTANS